MYSREYLKKYNYFDNFENDVVLDSLTGIISRKYMLMFIQNLINNKDPFSLQIIDIDNFKMINDTYGHQVGDEYLKKFALSLQSVVGDDGLVGRYGGDEFVIVYLGEQSYASIYAFLRKIYFDSILRKNQKQFGGIDFYLTATIGSSTFPQDSTNFEDLISKADKALYRGKYKGRNCFIIYIDEKHKDIKVTHRNFISLPEAISKINQLFEINEDINLRIRKMLSYVKQINHFTAAMFIDLNKNMLIESNNEFISGNIDFMELEEYFKNKSFVSISNIISNPKDTPLYRVCINNKISALLITKVKSFGHLYGYIAFMESGIQRIWQSDDEVLIQTIAKLIALDYHYNDK